MSTHNTISTNNVWASTLAHHVAGIGHYLSHDQHDTKSAEMGFSSANERSENVFWQKFPQVVWKRLLQPFTRLSATDFLQLLGIHRNPQPNSCSTQPFYLTSLDVLAIPGSSNTHLLRILRDRVLRCLIVEYSTGLMKKRTNERVVFGRMNPRDNQQLKIQASCVSATFWNERYHIQPAPFVCDAQTEGGGEEVRCLLACNRRVCKLVFGTLKKTNKNVKSLEISFPPKTR